MPMFTLEERSFYEQKGLVQKRLFYGDHSSSDSHANFMSGLGSALSFASSAVSLLSDLEPPASGKVGLTSAQYKKLVRRAASIAAFGKIDPTIVEDFLRILVAVDNITDMTNIANATQVAELADPSILLQVDLILDLPNLEKIAFIANALEGLVNLYRKYLATANNSGEGLEDLSSILSTLSSLISGFGGAGGAGHKLDSTGAEDALGHFMSEMLYGKRIPQTVLAKNPNLQSPSYSGKVFFGESPTCLSNVDMNQVFSKKIAAFPKPSNGSGATSFSFQNLGSLSKPMTLISAVSKIFTGSSSYKPDTAKAEHVEATTQAICDVTGAKSDESVELTRADTAIPLMIACSSVMSGTEKSPFPTNTFKDGWTLACSVNNSIRRDVPAPVEMMRTLL